MHPVDRSPVFVALGEELLAAHRASNDIADEGVPLGQVRSEIHFLPIDSRTNKMPRMNDCWVGERDGRDRANESSAWG